MNGVKYTIWAMCATAMLVTVAAALPAQAGPIGQALDATCSAVSVVGPLGAECKKHIKHACDALFEYGGFVDGNIHVVARLVPDPAGSVIDDEAKVQSGVKCYPD